MPHTKLTKLFFAGTDTDVGKTFAAALVAQMLRNEGKNVGVYKPVESGCHEVDGERIAEDAIRLWEAAGRPRSLAEVCPQRFLAPLAPPEAASAEGKTVDEDLLLSGMVPWEQDSDVLIIEGVGGLFSPVADGILNVDLARQLEAMLIIVSANRLGAIHQSLATCAAASHHGVEPSGIILCDSTGASELSAASNARQIARFSHVPILASIPFGGNEDDVESIQALLS
jgi:dethiobiotin synthetase